MAVGHTVNGKTSAVGQSARLFVEKTRELVISLNWFSSFDEFLEFLGWRDEYMDAVATSNPATRETHISDETLIQLEKNQAPSYEKSHKVDPVIVVTQRSTVGEYTLIAVATPEPQQYGIH